MATYYDEEERKKGGFWGKFLAVLLGFLFGIIATIGSIAAIGYALFAKIKIKDGISSVNKITGSDIDYKEYITDEYAEKTISALLSDLSSLVSEFQGGKGSLSSLNKISPQVETQVTKIADTLQSDYNIPLAVNSPHKDAEGNILDDADNVIIDKDGNVVKQDGNGNIVRDENGKAVMKNGAKATTVGDFLSGEGGEGESGGVVSILEKISVAGLLDATDSLDESNALVRALLYETDTYALDDENAFTAPDGTKYTYDAEAGQWTDGKGGHIRPVSAPLKAAAFSYAASDSSSLYVYRVYDKDGKLVCSLAAAEESGKFEAYDENDELKTSPRSVKSFMNALGGEGGDITDLLSDVQLSALLGLDEKTYSEDTKMLYALAYGTLGSDFKLEINADGKEEVVMLGGSKPATVSDLLDGGNALFDKISLDSIMTVKRTDNVICALAYGTKGKTYTWEEGDEAPAMLPVRYTLKADGLYDYNDEKAHAVLDEETGVYTVTIAETEGTIYYAKAEKTGDATYYLYQTPDCSGEKLLYQKTTLGDLLSGPNDLLNDIQLGSLMGLTATSDKILLALAYGTKGTDYEIVTTTDAETGEEIKTLVLLDGGKKPTTVGDLTDDESAGKLLNDIQLGSVLGISPLDKYDEDAENDPDPLMLALAYGEEGIDYEVAREDGENVIRWLGDSKPRTIRDLTAGNSSLFDSITLASVMDIKPDSPPLMIALAYGKESHYIMENGNFVMLPVQYTKQGDTLLDDDGEAVNAVLNPDTNIWTVTEESGKDITVRYAKADDDGYYYLYADESCAGSKIAYKKTSISDLKGDNASDIIYNIQLGTVLDISPLDKYDAEKEEPDALMLSLAYGEENTHYRIKTDAEGTYYIEWLTDAATGKKYAPRTIRDLQSGNIIDEVQLSSVLEVSPLDPDADKLMAALAFGNEGQHYEIVDGEIVWLTDAEGNSYAPRTIKDLKKGSAVIDDIYLSTVLDVGPSSGDIMLALAYGNEGEDYEIVNGEIHMLRDATPRTISELKKGDLIDNIRLSAVLTAAKKDDKISMYLLYGIEGTHYRYDEPTDKIEMLGREVGVLNNVAYDERGNALPGAVEAAGAGESFIYTYTYNDTIWLLTSLSGKTTETENGTIEYYCVTDETGAAVLYRPRTIGDLSGNSTLVSDITKDLTIQDLVGDTGDSKLLNAISAWKIDELSNQKKIMSLKMSDVIEIDDSSPAILKAMQGWTLGDLNDQDKINTLKLTDILEKTQVENNTILKHLQNSTVASLADDLENLKLQKVFADDVYKTVKTEEGTIYFVNQKGERLYENPADGKFYTSDTFEPATESARVLTGTWKYLLTDKEGKEGDYTITDMGTLVSNMTANIQKATLNDLKEDGIIDVTKKEDGTTFLDSAVTYKFEFTYTYPEDIPMIGGTSKTETIGEVTTKYYRDGIVDDEHLKISVGELTITELLNYVGEVVGLFSE